MVRYVYSQQVAPPAPFVHVSVRPPYEGPAGVEVPAQIDTAADLSVMPGGSSRSFSSCRSTLFRLSDSEATC